jgi:mono/diheme cytochrome c family protein
MRKYKWYAVVLIAFAVLAGRGLYADFQAGYYTPAGPGTMHQTLANVTSTDATYDAGQYPFTRPELVPGDGLQQVENDCNTCHSPRYIIMQPPLPADAWAAEVNKMIKTYGASIPADDAQKIIGYLQTHYTPETRKR